MKFYKYQGTGNDFIVIDDRDLSFNLSKEEIHLLCDRRFGIGSDGLMLLQNAEEFDFRMVYFNADGSEGSMCGNGGRCLVRFAHDLGIITNKTQFIATDGPHEAEVFSDQISLKMQDVKKVDNFKTAFFTNTGSPHYIDFLTDLTSFPVKPEGEKIRYSEDFKAENGTNVNFAEILNDTTLFVRTYERGVEDETYSCGTGVTAAALAANYAKNFKSPVQIQTLGGKLEVKFDKKEDNSYFNIYLIGPAEKVFEGII